MARKTQEISIYRIAEEAGVSASTVSRVINRRHGIGEATRDKVNHLLAKYNFSPNYPLQRAKRIALVLPNQNFSSYMRKALQGVFDYTDAHDQIVHIITMQSPKKESLLELIREQQCFGVIAILPQAYQEDLITLSHTELLTVTIDCKMENSNFGYIDNDSYSGSVAATQYLLDLKHYKIGYLSYLPQSQNILKRFEGFKDTMKRHKLELPQRRVVTYSDSIDIPKNQQGKIAMERLLKYAPEITAVMAADDNIASGAMTAIHEAGLKIPGDISIIGFDNYQETANWYPALTTVDHPISKAGYMAAEAIHSGLQSPCAWRPPKKDLPTKLLIRKSTGPAPS